MAHSVSLIGYSGGPFISGAKNSILTLGEPIDLPPPPTDPAILDLANTLVSPQGGGAGPSSRKQHGRHHEGTLDQEQITELLQASKAKPHGNPSLKDMVEAGVVIPGPDVVSLSYKGHTYTAALRPDGTIVFDGEEFYSPSAFSVHVKRLITPGKQGDDGWRSVYVNDIVLHDLRSQYQQLATGGAHLLHHGKGYSGAGGGSKKRGAAAGHGHHGHYQEQHEYSGGGGSSGGRSGKGGKKAGGGGSSGNSKKKGGKDVQKLQQEYPDEVILEEVAPGQEAQRWVQCSRCEVWRVVPDEAWPDVEADDREDWFCEDAWWDVEEMEPFTAPCK